MDNTICQRYITLIKVIFLVLYAGGRLPAQDEALIFNRLSIAQGLSSQDHNYYIHQDARGFVWISSMQGLNRFDGLTVKQYGPIPGDSLSLADPQIQGMIYEDRSGHLWISTVSAVFQYDPATDRFFPHRLQLEGERELGYRVLHLDTLSNELWIRYKEKIIIYDPEAPGQMTVVDTLKDVSGRGLHLFYDPERQGHCLLLPQSNGWQVSYYTEGQKIGNKKFPLAGRPGYREACFYPEGDQRLWVGVDTGLVKNNAATGTIEIFNRYQGQQVSGIVGILPWKDGRLLVATKEKGLYFFDKQAAQFRGRLLIEEEETITPFLYPIDRIYLDRHQTLWISSPGRGIYYSNLNKRKFNTFLKDQQARRLGLHNVSSVAQKGDGSIWCLTPNGIAVLDEAGNLLPDYHQYSGSRVPFSNSRPFYIYNDRQDETWVYVQSGLYVLPKSSGSFKALAFTPDDQLIRPVFTYVYQLSNGRRLVSTLRAGMLEIDPKSGEEYRLVRLKEMQDDAQYMVIFESSGKKLFLNRVWESLVIFDIEGRQLVYDTTLRYQPYINGIVEDRAGDRLWIATPQGLYQLELGRAEYRIARDSLPFQALQDILQDTLGNLWISSTRGMIKYHPDSGEYHIYSTADGLQGLEFNFWSAAQLSNGQFAFGGINGLNLFDPYDISNLQVKANPTLIEILVNNEEAFGLTCIETGATTIDRIRKLKFGYEDNTLSFRFAALEYSYPAANEFQYRMSGVDPGWVRSGTQNFARYANLRPGNYKFEVKASNSDGVWSSRIAGIDIVVTPPWWQTWWFRTLLILAGLSALYAYYRNRINRIRKEAAFRQKEAEYKQLVAETETAVLRLQMNPHFIFNSMNSINSYILEKNLETANDYLNRFAKLMRMILKFGEKRYIALSQEIELLELYLQTEAMRFEGKFDYLIQTAEDIDPDELILPPMILQPFVENAILHGIAPKKTKGKITVRFWCEANALWCSVEDNGVGRQAASDSRLKSNLHESKALSITRRRLQLLETREGKPTALQIRDLFDKEGQPAGTKVLLELPVL